MSFLSEQMSSEDQDLIRSYQKKLKEGRSDITPEERAAMALYTNKLRLNKKKNTGGKVRRPPRKLKKLTIPRGEFCPSPQTTGAVAEIRVCEYLLRMGFEVFRNIKADGPADIVFMDKETGFKYAIDVKRVRTSQGGADLTEEQRRLGITIVRLHDDGSLTFVNSSEKWLPSQ